MFQGICFFCDCTIDGANQLTESIKSKMSWIQFICIEQIEKWMSWQCVEDNAMTFNLILNIIRCLFTCAALELQLQLHRLILDVEKKNAFTFNRSFSTHEKCFNRSLVIKCATIDHVHLLWFFSLKKKKKKRRQARLLENDR